MNLKICLVTTNEERFNFVKKVLSEFNIIVEKVPLNLNEIQADNVKEIALAKAIDASKQIGKPCICEDTELRIKALNGFPGPFLKFAQTKLVPDNIISLLKNETNRKAVFKSVLVFAQPNGKTKIFSTIVVGKILHKKIGAKGKGWDSIFLVDKYKKSLSQLTPSERFNLWSNGYKQFGKWFSGMKIR